jgi:hypothetical protein
MLGRYFGDILNHRTAHIRYSISDEVTARLCVVKSLSRFLQVNHNHIIYYASCTFPAVSDLCLRKSTAIQGAHRRPMWNSV